MPDSHATIVSLLPYELTEHKNGLVPAGFIVPSKGNNICSLTVIDDKVHFLINPDVLSDAKEIRHIKVPVPAYQVAESIINDYVGGLLAVELPDVIPGLFYVGGTFRDIKEFSGKFGKELNFYKNCQNAWFQRLVIIADDIWAKSRSPLGISDIMRDACKSLGYERDWSNPIPSELVDKCPVCVNPVNRGALKCVACGHILNKAEYDRVMAGGATK